MSCFIELLREHQHDFLHHYDNHLNHNTRHAINALLSCKTSEQRKMSWCCAHCNHQAQHPLSCGHRHCPQCQHQTTRKWLQRQLKADIGFTMVLHTHNRRRDLPPHIHVIMPCRYYDADKNQWHKGNKHFLFNGFTLAKVWRAQILEAINKHAQINLPVKYPKKWVVDCRKVGFGEKAYQYLSRYLYRGVISDKDIINYDNNTVTFKYQDSQTKKTAIRTLPVLKFLWLILQHVLPKGLQRVRDCGYLRGNAGKLRQRIQILLINTKDWIIPEKQPQPKSIRIYPCCKHEMLCMGVIINLARTS